MSIAELAHDFRRFCRRLLRSSHSSTLASWSAFPSPDSLLQAARDYFEVPADAPPLASLIEPKLAPARACDLAAVQRAVAICTCGSSGSLLLASYLDGHDDVIAMPQLFSQAIYPFFSAYGHLSLRDKLLAYPFFSEDSRGLFDDMFASRGGRTAARHYAAAVEALLQAHIDQPAAVLGSRRSFFVLVHLAYRLALGRSAGTGAPLLVYAQHIWDNDLAQQFVADFPQGKFIHTVRDPISNCGRHLARYTGNFLAAALVVSHLTYADVPHTGMASRSRAIRFEDLHLRLESTMRSLASWLELPFQRELLESTFNGEPYTVRSGTTTWSGPRPQQAARDVRNVPRRDRALLYAVLHEDFIAWGYPCPAAFAHSSVRLLVCLPLSLIPMRIELVTARAYQRAISGQGLRFAFQGLARLLLARAAIMLLLWVELARRLVTPKVVVVAEPAASLEAALESPAR